MVQHYDVAVIGGQPAGMIAAALLAKRGRRVLLVDNGEDGSTYKRGGLFLPLVPTLVPSLESAPAAQRVHDELGVGPELRTTAHVPERSFQAVLPGHRFDVMPELPKLLAELALEFPDVAPALERFFTRLFEVDDTVTAALADAVPLAPATLAERWRARRWHKQLQALAAPFEHERWLTGVPPEHPLRDLLLGPLAFFSHLATDTPSTLQAVRLIARYFRGVIEFNDRLGGLGTFLLRAAQKAGVEMRRATEVQGIGINGKRLTQLQLAGERTAFSADFFVASTVGPFHPLLPPGGRAARLVAEEESIRTTLSLLVLNLVVARDVVPCGMGRALFLLNGRRLERDGAPKDPPAFLRRYPAQRGELGSVRGKDPIIDEAHEVLSVACPVRTADVAHSPERLRVLKEQLVARVARVVPFLSEYLRDTSTPTDPSTWDAASTSGPRRIDPWRLHPLYTLGEPPLLGVAARSPRTCFKNLVLCGRELLPGLGVEGEYMSGLAVADLLGELAGKKWEAKAVP